LLFAIKIIGFCKVVAFVFEFDALSDAVFLYFDLKATFNIDNICSKIIKLKVAAPFRFDCSVVILQCKLAAVIIDDVMHGLALASIH